MTKMLNSDKLMHMWRNDSQMSDDLLLENRRIFDLHGKYVDLWRIEKAKVKVIEGDLKLLRLQKHEFYLQGPSRESQEAGWELPPRGKVLRNDLDMYLEGDPQIRELTFKLEIIKINVETLKFIIDAIYSRQFIISNIMKHHQWLRGA